MKQTLTLFLITIFLSPCITLFAQTELEGVWTGYEIQGLPGDVTITIMGDSAEYTGTNGLEWYKGTFIINTDTLPKQYDVLIEDASLPGIIGETALAIYEILGDSLHIAINGPGNSTRPTSFEPGNGPRIYMLGLQPASVVELSPNIPDKFTLYQNYPNPFNPNTIIQYTVSSRQIVTLKVYDVLGNIVVTLVNEEKLKGFYEVEFSAIYGEAYTLPSGIYLYQLKAGNFTETKKMILMK